MTPESGLAIFGGLPAGERGASDDRMERKIHWITETAQLEALVETAGGGPLSLDSEADSLHRYPEKVCLVQLHVGGQGHLIDPLAGLDLSPLGPLLADRELLKILHGADYDLRVLHRDFGLEIRGLFDTMVAARLLGESAFGLAALLERHFGVSLDKKYQRADWSRRPLPAAMARYAALDTQYLEALAGKLRLELERLGRMPWAEEEFRRLEAVRWNSEPDPEPFRKIKGSAGLGRRGLAALRELAVLREAEARRRGRPPFMVLSNDALIRLAGELPESQAELAGLSRLPDGWRRGPSARTLLDAIRSVLSLPEEELPERRSRRRPVRSPGHDSRLRALCRERDALAASLRIEPSVLAAKSVLEQVLLGVQRGEEPDTVPDLRTWQAELLRPAFGRIQR